MSSGRIGFMPDVIQTDRDHFRRDVLSEGWTVNAPDDTSKVTVTVSGDFHLNDSDLMNCCHRHGMVLADVKIQGDRTELVFIPARSLWIVDPH